MNRSFGGKVNVSTQFISGFGLVSEQCPSSSVGCRIRANKDHVGEFIKIEIKKNKHQLIIDEMIFVKNICFEKKNKKHFTI